MKVKRLKVGMRSLENEHADLKLLADRRLAQLQSGRI